MAKRNEFCDIVVNAEWDPDNEPIIFKSEVFSKRKLWKTIWKGLDEEQFNADFEMTVEDEEMELKAAEDFELKAADSSCQCSGRTGEWWCRIWAGEDYEHFAETLGCEYGRMLGWFFRVPNKYKPVFKLTKNKKGIKEYQQLQSLIFALEDVRAEFLKTKKTYKKMEGCLGTKPMLNDNPLEPELK